MTVETKKAEYAVVKKKTPDFEQQIQRLQTIVQELERADLPLERNVALYKEGRELAESCRKLLEQAKLEVSLCDPDEDVRADAAGQSASDGGLRSGAFDPAGDAAIADDGDVEKEKHLWT